jgi:hypothetical protein
MEDLKTRKKCPRGAVIPRKIDRETLFSLDIDDSIWDSRGLGDDGENPPLWMADDNVIAGIRAWLMLERCNEEEERLISECMSLRSWGSKQWHSVTNALAKYTHPDIVHPLNARRDTLLMLVSEWKPLVAPISISDDPWGPSDTELAMWQRQHQSCLIKLAPFQPLTHAVTEDHEDNDGEWESDPGEPDYLLETVDDFYLDDLYGHDGPDLDDGEAAGGLYETL